MASICSDPNGFKRILFVGLDGKRKTLRIGKKKSRDADAFKQKLESLLSAKQMQSSPDRETSVWVSQLSDDLHAKLALHGLVDSRTATASESLVRFVDAFIANRESDTKPSTRTVYKRTRKHLVDFFGVKKTLTEVTTSNAIDFRRYLIGRGMADNTVRRTCGIARQFLADAVERELVTKNPFSTKSISVAVRGNAEKFQFVSREVADKVLNACPNAQTRLVFALARFGGLRTPSETLKLRWSDIDFERGRMTVHAPKTEHHEGKATRVVPIFPELEPYLRDAFDPENVFVVTIATEATKNFRTRFTKIIKRAGVTPWPKLFQNLRATRQTELSDQFPAHVVCEWLGNSQAVANKHYLHTTEEHFEQVRKAAHKAAQYPSESTENAGISQQPQTVAIHENQAFPLENADFQWAMRDSNPRHPLCKSGALTN